MLQLIKSLAVILLLSSCSTIPGGPSVLVLPGSNMDFTRFHDDDLMCRQFARGQLTTQPEEPDSIEAGQTSYDISYIQCMYGKGHRVPVPGAVSYGTLKEWHSPPPPNLPPPQK